MNFLDRLRRMFRPAPPAPPPAPATPAEVYQPRDGRVPLGLRQNNPGNLRPLANGEQWRGQTGVANGFCVFADMGDGLRAMALNLRTYYRKHGLDTIAEVVARYAPAGDRNNVPAYVASVCENTGYKPHERLDLEREDTMVALVRAMVRHEQGQMPFSEVYLRAHVRRGLRA
jgi:hypothetical protein